MVPSFIDVSLTSDVVQIGGGFLPRRGGAQDDVRRSKLLLLPSQLPHLQSLALALNMNWMPILVSHDYLF